MFLGVFELTSGEMFPRQCAAHDKQYCLTEYINELCFWQHNWLRLHASRMSATAQPSCVFVLCRCYTNTPAISTSMIAVVLQTRSNITIVAFVWGICVLLISVVCYNLQLAGMINKVFLFPGAVLYLYCRHNIHDKTIAGCMMHPHNSLLCTAYYIEWVVLIALSLTIVSFCYFQHEVFNVLLINVNNDYFWIRVYFSYSTLI